MYSSLRSKGTVKTFVVRSPARIWLCSIQISAETGHGTLQMTWTKKKVTCSHSPEIILFPYVFNSSAPLHINALCLRASQNVSADAQQLSQPVDQYQYLSQSFDIHTDRVSQPSSSYSI